MQVLRKERGELDREQRFLAAHAAAHDCIYRYFRRRTDGPETAEDLCSEVFKIVWEKSSLEDAYNPPQPAIKYRVVYFTYLDP